MDSLLSSERERVAERVTRGNEEKMAERLALYDDATLQSADDVGFKWNRRIEGKGQVN